MFIDTVSKEEELRKWIVCARKHKNCETHYRGEGLLLFTILVTVHQSPGTSYKYFTNKVLVGVSHFSFFLIYLFAAVGAVSPRLVMTTLSVVSRFSTGFVSCGISSLLFLLESKLKSNV